MKIKCFIFCFTASCFISTNIIQPQRITAKHGLPRIDSLISIINPDAKLLWLWADSIDLNGTSISWNYKFGDYSNDIHTYYFLHSTIDSVNYDSLNHLVIPGSMYIDSSWIDSDSAIIIAENKGGKDFRESHNNNFNVFARLGKPLVPYSTNQWYFFYTSLDDPPDDLYIYFNAAGDSIAGVKSMNKIPNDFLLYQNYPNPFNSSTIFSFYLSSNTFISLKIFDLNGREIETIISQRLSRGNHNVQWESTKLSSGVYFYRLESNNFTKVKKMVLLE